MSHGMFFKQDTGPSTIELLLNDVDAAAAVQDSSSDAAAAVAAGVPPPHMPTVEDFLDEEDITRECRGDNKRLIAYLCRPEVVSALVSLCINIRGDLKPPTAAASSLQTTGAAAADSTAAAPSAPSPGDAFSNDPFDAAPGEEEGLAAPSASSSAAAAGAAPRDAVATPPGDPEASAAASTAADGAAALTPTAEAEEAAKKARFTRSYIASELLSADVRPLADALVGDDAIFNSLFSCLESNAPGELDAFVANHFAKIISSLLKTRNKETLAQMTRRRGDFVNGLLKHLANQAIAELVVRILDGPEVDRGYSSVVVAPSRAALDLLVASDVLSGLAAKFVDAAQPSSTSPTPSTYAEATALRRLREETMTHATAAIQGIANRVLQLPSLGFPIPPMLSPYATPAVVVSMLNAGLNAFAAGGGASTGGSRVEEGGASSVVVASTSGTSAALLHALTLAATLLTTEANVVRDESSEKGPYGAGGDALPGTANVAMNARMLGMGSGRRGGGVGAGRGIGGIGASIQAQQRQREAQDEASANNTDSSSGADSVDERAVPDGGLPASDATGAGSETATASPPLPEPVVGSPIVSTSALESELVARFERLSNMFGTDANDEAEGLPLGSLRLKLAEFFAACMKKSSQETVDVIVKLGVPKKLLALFLRYEWSSMLHGVVTQSIVSAFDEQPSGAPARKAWIDAGLVPWLLNAWALNEQRAESEEIRFRAGYMGHLIQIGTELRRYVYEQDEHHVSENFLPTDQLNSLATFSEEQLAPAHKVEVTPLCEKQGEGGSDAEEVYEEATEVFDMGEVMEGLTQGEPDQALDRFAKYLVQSSEADEEEIETVDVGDLSHFGGEDEEVSAIGIEGDHDIPAEMRAAMNSDSATAAPPPVAPPPALNSMAYTGSGTATDAAISEIPSPGAHPHDGVATVRPTSDREATPDNVTRKNTLDRALSGDHLDQPSIVDSEVTSMDLEGNPTSAALKGGLNASDAHFGDSSSDEDGDEGTYAEFMDATDGNHLSAAMEEKLKLGNPVLPVGTSPEVADIIEVDEQGEAPLNSVAAAADVTAVDDGDDSSGGEGEWTTFDPASEQFSDSKGDERLKTRTK